MKQDDTESLPAAVFTSDEWQAPPEMASRDTTSDPRWGVVAAALAVGVAIGWLLASPSTTIIEPEVTTTLGVAPRPEVLPLTEDEFADLIAGQDPVVVPTPDFADSDLNVTLAPLEVSPGRSFSFWHLDGGQLSIELSEEALLLFFPKEIDVTVDEDAQDASSLIVTATSDNSTFAIERPTAESPIDYSGGISSSGEYVYIEYDTSETALPEPDLLVYDVNSGKAIVKMALADGLGIVRCVGNDQLAFIERVAAQQHLRIFDASTKQAITVATMTGAVAWAMQLS